MGLPEPLKTRPSMSSETGVRRMSPVNSHIVFLASIPDVPSNTWSEDVRLKRSGQVIFHRVMRE